MVKGGILLIVTHYGTIGENPLNTSENLVPVDPHSCQSIQRESDTYSNIEKMEKIANKI
jgi:hypothetical protein